MERLEQAIEKFVEKFGTDGEFAVCIRPYKDGEQIEVTVRTGYDVGDHNAMPLSENRQYTPSEVNALICTLDMKGDSCDMNLPDTLTPEEYSLEEFEEVAGERVTEMLDELTANALPEEKTYRHSRFDRIFAGEDVHQPYYLRVVADEEDGETEETGTITVIRGDNDDPEAEQLTQPVHCQLDVAAKLVNEVYNESEVSQPEMLDPERGVPEADNEAVIALGLAVIAAKIKEEDN